MTHEWSLSRWLWLSPTALYDMYYANKVDFWLIVQNFKCNDHSLLIHSIPYSRIAAYQAPDGAGSSPVTL